MHNTTDYSETLLAGQQSGDNNYASYNGSNQRSQNSGAEAAYDDLSNNSSDIDQAEWDAVKEIEENSDDSLEECDDDNLSEGHQDRMMDALENLTKDLFQDSKSKKSSLNTLSRQSTMMRTSSSFHSFYAKSCKEFLQSRDDKLVKQRKQKEDEQNKDATYKPTLVSKQQKKHVPLLEKAKAMEVRKAQAAEKARREREEQEQKEIQQLTFKPAINDISKALVNYNNKEETIDRLYHGKAPSVQEKQTNQGEVEKLFKPQINKKSYNLAKNIIEKTSSKVEDRLLLQASMTQAKKAKLIDDSMSSFTPKLNKNTQKIIEQIKIRDYATQAREEEVEAEPQAVDYHTNLKMAAKRLTGVIGDSKSIEVPNTDRHTPKRARLGESNVARASVQKLQFDDQLMDNLKQLTMLLQVDDHRPNTTRHDRHY